MLQCYSAFVKRNKKIKNKKNIFKTSYCNILLKLLLKVNVYKALEV